MKRRKFTTVAYAKEVWRDSFSLWDRARRVTVFAGVVLGSLLLGVLLAIGVYVKFKPIVGLWVSAALLVWLTILVFIVSPFRIWRQSKEKIADLEDQLTPKISIEFDYRNSEFVRNTFLSDAKKTPTRWIRVLPISETDAPIEQCRGFIARITRLGEDGTELASSSGDRMPLYWSATGGDSSPHDVVCRQDRARQFLDVVFSVAGSTKLHLPIEDSAQLNANAGLLVDPGRYLFSLTVRPKTGQPANIDLMVDWDGQWDHLTAQVQPLEASGGGQ